MKKASSSFSPPCNHTIRELPASSNILLFLKKREAYQGNIEPGGSKLRGGGIIVDALHRGKLLLRQVQSVDLYIRSNQQSAPEGHQKTQVSMRAQVYYIL